MPVSSSPWPFPLYELLLLDTPAEMEKKMQKIEARRHQKEGGLGEGKGERRCQEQQKREWREIQQGTGDFSKSDGKEHSVGESLCLCSHFKNLLSSWSLRPRS